MSSERDPKFGGYPPVPNYDSVSSILILKYKDSPQNANPPVPIYPPIDPYELPQGYRQYGHPYSQSPMSNNAAFQTYPPQGFQPPPPQFYQPGSQRDLL